MMHHESSVTLKEFKHLNWYMGMEILIVKNEELNV